MGYFHVLKHFFGKESFGTAVVYLLEKK